MNQNDHMQWRRLGFVAMVVVLAGCTNGDESGAPNTAPIREETTTVVVATEAPATSTSAPVTAAAVSSSVAAVDSVPKPVGEDYRVPVVVKFVPSTDAEREVLAVATELLVKYRRFELQEVSDQVQLSTILDGDALDEFAKIAATLSGDINEPSVSDRVVVESLAPAGPESWTVNVCQVDGARVFVKSSTGELVKDNESVESLRKSYELRRGSDEWRIVIDQISQVTEGVDACAKS